MKIFKNLRWTEWRVFVAVVVIVGVAATVYAMRLPRWYEASGTVKYVGVGEDGGSHHAGSGLSDWPEMIAAPKSPQSIQSMIGRLTREETARFLAPFDRSSSESQNSVITHYIQKNQRVTFDGLERTMVITYRHPDRMMAARVVNLIVDEISAYQARLLIEDRLKQVDELVLRARGEEQEVRDLTAKLDVYRASRAKDAGISFETNAEYRAMTERRDAVQQRLNGINFRIRDTATIVRMSTQYWRTGERAVPSDEGDYLLMPILKPLAWGWGIAVFSGVAAVGVMRGVWRVRRRAA